jgi:hypothetical protein
MDVLNPDIWKQQWSAFVSAPYIIAPLIAGAVWLGWWLRGIKSEGKIGGLNERIAGFEDQLKFATEKASSANQAKDEVIRQFNDLKEEVVATAENVALTARVAKIEAAIEKLSTANNAVSSAISGILNATESPDIANARGTVE